MAPKKSIKLDGFSISLSIGTVSLILWLLPLILGKYSDTSYSYIPAADISKELVTIVQLAKLNSITTQSKSHQGKANLRDKIEFRNKVESKHDLPPCPLVSPKLQGLNYKIQHNNIDTWNPKFVKNYASEHGIKSGGTWEPTGCEPQYTVTVIIGQRNRTRQLHQILKHLHPFMARQLLRYRIIIVEQKNSDAYNRGKLFNIGYKEAKRLWPDETLCVVLHDVDLFPLHDHNTYTCGHHPRHMSVAVDKFRFQLPYSTLCGGALAIQARHYEAVNGFSNRFEGWGGEDDDFCTRLSNKGLELQRFDPSICVYSMLPHDPALPAPQRYNVLYRMIPSAADGLSTLQCTVNTTLLPLHTSILADW